VRTPSPRITLPNGQLWDSMGFHGCQRSEVGFCGDKRDCAGAQGDGVDTAAARVSALKGRLAAARCANAKRGCASQTKNRANGRISRTARRAGMGIHGKGRLRLSWGRLFTTTAQQQPVLLKCSQMEPLRHSQRNNQENDRYGSAPRTSHK